MAKVLGLGGLFFFCDDVEATKDWYVRVLGLQMNDYGGFDFLHADAAAPFPTAARTIFAPFKAGGDYFKPSERDWMFNLMVDDLDGMIERIKSENVALEGDIQEESYGRFAWVMDPDGRKVELWQPIEPPSPD
ncbi:MAG: VOC family protein [Pseudomonadota bacterium]